MSELQTFMPRLDRRTGCVPVKSTMSERPSRVAASHPTALDPRSSADRLAGQIKRSKAAQW